MVDNNLLLLGLLTASLVSEIGHQLKNNRLISSLSRFFLIVSVVFLFSKIDTGEFQFSWSSPGSIVLFVLSIGVLWIVDLKLNKITSWFKWPITERLRLSLVFVLLGVLFYLSSFLNGITGLALIGVGFSISTLIREEFRIYGIAALILTLGLGFQNLLVMSTDLSLGKNLLGFLAGIFSITFSSEVFGTQRDWKKGLVSSIPGTALLMVLIFLGTQKNDLGGIDGFVFFLIGSSIAMMYMANKVFVVGILVSMLFGLSVITVLPREEQNFQMSVAQSGSDSHSEKEKVISFDDFIGLSMSSMKGDYSIVSDSSSVSFELGPKGGRTKGMIRNVNGSLAFGNQVKADVQMDVKDLTTFNSIRDESLLSADYFNVEKFSGFNYVATGLTTKENLLELKGDFTMLGVTKEQTVELKVAKINDANGIINLIGKGKIDRTIYGMKPDPKEGNLVDFTLAVQLKKK